MNTTLMIKIDKRLRDDAKHTAGELGVPLTTVVSALLKQFVRDREVTVSLNPVLTKAKIALFEKISREADREMKTAKRYTNAEDLIADLKLL